VSEVGPEAFVRDIRHPLVGSLALYCGDAGVAEELAQEALAKAWQRWDRLDDPKAWTYRTAFNLASTWGRRRSAERRANRRASAGRTPAEVDRADVHAVRAAVAALPDRQRAVIVCRFFLTLDVRETASVLRCAEGTVKAATHQALAALRRSGLIDDPAPQPEEVETT
jgi:RNA polymerase sigma-70 factor (ECF subfamily)